jgi:ParB-like chromosome segregation protein Spo0J
MMTKAELIELGEDIKKSGLQQAIAVIMEDVEVVASADGSYDITDPIRTIVLDGRNRLDAMEAVGLKIVDEKGQLLDSVPYIVIDPKAIDPYSYVFSANILRRHLQWDQRRTLIEELLKRDPGRSDRQIAEITHTSPSSVGKVRHELEATGDVSTVDTRTDSQGRKQPAKKSAPGKSRDAIAINIGTSGQTAEEEQLDRVCAAADFTEPLASPPTDAPAEPAETQSQLDAVYQNANFAPPAKPVAPSESDVEKPATAQANPAPSLAKPTAGRAHTGGYDSTGANSQQLLISLEKVASQLAYVANNTTATAAVSTIMDDARVRVQFTRVPVNWLVEFAGALAEAMREPGPSVH